MDATPLYAAGARIDELAAVVRARIASIGRYGVTIRWRSPAAREFQARVENVCLELIVCATQLEALADRVRLRAARLAAGP